MKGLPERLCGKPFGEKELSVVKEKIINADPFLRSEIARRVCRALDWVDITGKPKLKSAQVGLLRLHREGFIELPLPRNGNGNKTAMIHDDIELPDSIELTGTVGDLTGLRLEIVEGERLSRNRLCIGQVKTDENATKLQPSPIAGDAGTEWMHCYDRRNGLSKAHHRAN